MLDTSGRDGIRVISTELCVNNMARGGCYMIIRIKNFFYESRRNNFREIIAYAHICFEPLPLDVRAW